MSETRPDVNPPEPPASTPRNRGRRLRRIMYTEQEYELIKDAAEAEGQEVADYIRDESLDALVVGKPFLPKNAANAELMRELRERGVALTRVANTARETGALPAADGLETALQELRALIRQIASARPPRARTASHQRRR
jgi:hypothetical protein